MGNSASQSNLPDCLKRSKHFPFLAKIFQDASTVKENSRTVTISSFKELFSGQSASMIELLYKHFITIANTDQNVFCHDMQKIAFISGFDILLNLECGSQDMVTFYFDMFSDGSDGKQYITDQDVINILSSIHSIQFGQDSQELAAVHIKVLAKSLLSQGLVNKHEYIKKAFQIWPRIFNYIHCCILKSLSKLEGSDKIMINNVTLDYCTKEIVQLFNHFNGTSFVEGSTKIQLSSSDSQDFILDPVALWLLSLSIPSLYLKTYQTADTKHNEDLVSEWRMLYDSNEHGLSHNRFKHHCFSYRGPTVTAILLENNVILVLAIDVEWRESTKCFGDSGTILYQIYPQFKILAEKNMVLFNEKSRGLPVGLILGNNPSKPLVSLLDGLTSARLGYLGLKESSVQRIQVCGCAGIKAEADQKQQQNWEKRQAEQLQKVKLPGAWDENADKAILEMAGITTEHARR